MMKIWSGILAASFVATVGLSAQQAPPTSTPGAQQPAPSAQASGQSKTVTISGCLQAAPASAATAGGGAASSATAPKFVLAAKPATGAAGGAVGTSGTAMRYSLEGEEKTISPHLNHQVEITGMVQPSAAGAGAAASPTLKVESLKMVSATCS